VNEIPELERAAADLLSLRAAQVQDSDRWKEATDAFLDALDRCDDPALIERLLLDDVQDDLPIDAKSHRGDRARRLQLQRALCGYGSLTSWVSGP
jgi:hypothetical protein